MTNHETDRRETVEYFLQTQQPDDTWSDSSSRMDDVEWARERLAMRRQKMPQWEHRIVWRATSLAVGVLEDGAAAVSVPPPATRADDQTALRDSVAEALRPGSRDRSGQYPEGLMRDVDAVLAVLPEPAGRAAVRAAAFDEAAEKLAGLDPVKAALAGQHAWNDAAGIVRHMARQERRLADEAQQPEPETEPTAEDIARANVLALHQIGEQLAGIETWMWEHLADVREAAKAQSDVAGEQQNETPEADGLGEPAELRDLPREVRHLVHAVDRMRSDWAEAPEGGPERREMWTAVHAACDAVWNRDEVPE